MNDDETKRRLLVLGAVVIAGVAALVFAGITVTLTGCPGSPRWPEQHHAVER